MQYGPHAELLKDQDGQYYALWTAQAQYYTEEVSDAAVDIR
jgi:ATP-binding cassette subfamily B protein